MDLKNMKVAIYCRVANKEQVREDSGIEYQKQKISAYLKTNGRVKSKEIYIDNGFSGRTYNRPEFKRMIRDIKNKKVNAIIVTDLSRFGRTNNSLNRIKALKSKYNVDFISITDDVNTMNESEFELNVIVHNIIRKALKETYSKNKKIAMNMEKED